MQSAPWRSRPWSAKSSASARQTFAGRCEQASAPNHPGVPAAARKSTAPCPLHAGLPHPGRPERPRNSIAGDSMAGRGNCQGDTLNGGDDHLIRSGIQDCTADEKCSGRGQGRGAKPGPGYRGGSRRQPAILAGQHTLAVPVCTATRLPLQCLPRMSGFPSSALLAPARRCRKRTPVGHGLRQSRRRTGDAGTAASQRGKRRGAAKVAWGVSGSSRMRGGSPAWGTGLPAPVFAASRRAGWVVGSRVRSRPCQGV